MRLGDIIKMVDDYANTEFTTIDIDIDDDTWVKIAEMAHERDITFNQMVTLILEECIEEYRAKMEMYIDPHPCVECEYGDNGGPSCHECAEIDYPDEEEDEIPDEIGDLYKCAGCGNVFAREEMDDGACECGAYWRAAEPLKYDDGTEELLDDECPHDNTVLTAHWGYVCKDCGEYGVVTKEELEEIQECDCTCGHNGCYMTSKGIFCPDCEEMLEEH